MKNKIRLLGLMMATVLSLPALAQSRSTVQLHTGSYYIFGYERLSDPQFSYPTGVQDNEKNAVALLGIQYQYRLDKNLSVFADYTITTNQPDFIDLNRTSRFATYRFNLNPVLEVNNGRFEDADGLLVSRNNYHFFDAGLGYRYSFSAKHKLTGKIGLSYAYGTNVYLTKMTVSPYPNQAWSEVIPETTYRSAHEGYWGAVAGLSYDYTFWENRLSAGADIHFRYYSGRMPGFMDYGLHVGYNF